MCVYGVYLKPLEDTAIRILSVSIVVSAILRVRGCPIANRLPPIPFRTVPKAALESKKDESRREEQEIEEDRTCDRGVSAVEMACSAQSMTIESYPDTAVSSSATPSEETALLRDRRRRHSYDNARKNSCDYDGDAVYLRVSVLLWEWLFGWSRMLTRYRSNCSSRNWNDGCTGLNNTGSPIWCRSMRAYDEDMRLWRRSGTHAPMRRGS